MYLVTPSDQPNARLAVLARFLGGLGHRAQGHVASGPAAVELSVPAADLTHEITGWLSAMRIKESDIREDWATACHL